MVEAEKPADRRADARYALHLIGSGELLYRHLPGGARFEVRCLNISRGGLMMTMDSEVRTGDVMRVVLVEPVHYASIAFEGTVTGDLITGTVRIGAVPGVVESGTGGDRPRFTLRRTVVLPPPYALERVTFRSDSVELGGTVYLPEARPHTLPGVVILQGSSANLLFAGSGYLSQRDLYRLGALTTACNMTIYLIIGTPWFRLVLR